MKIITEVNELMGNPSHGSCLKNLLQGSSCHSVYEKCSPNGNGREYLSANN